MKNKIPSIWEDCKTKEQKDAFIKKLEEINKKGKFRSFMDYYFDEQFKEIKDRITISKDSLRELKNWCKKNKRKIVKIKKLRKNIKVYVEKTRRGKKNEKR